MSLYNLLFGQNELANLLLAIVDFERSEIPRYRDIYWDGEKIVVLTRTGGGNRDEYYGSNNEMTLHPGYIRDEDDDYDCTYAKFYYSLPPKFEYMRDWLNDRVSQEPSQKWEDLFAKLDSDDHSDPAVQRCLKLGEELSAKIHGAINK